MSDKVAVAFFLDGEKYAMRLWQHIPRVGDEVMLGAGRKAPAGEKIACIVKRVVWGVEAETDPVDFQAVNIEIERV